MSVSALSTGQRKAIKAIVGNNPNHAVTYKEAAESLGISEWALKTHLQRIRKKNPRLYQSHMDKRRMNMLRLDRTNIGMRGYTPDAGPKTECSDY